MKVIKVTVRDGREYIIPVSVIADIRAKYYTEKDSDTTYEDEFNHVMEDDYEAIDWYRNNMNPDEVLDHVRLIKEATPVPFEDLEDEDCTHEILEHPAGGDENG
jgi:hypothetical protein